MHLDGIDYLIAQKTNGWRFKNSAWILVVVLGMGIFSFIGWLWAEGITKSRSVKRAATFWCVLTVLLYVSAAASSGVSGRMDTDSVPYRVTAILLALCWIGSSIHAALVRRAVLRAVIQCDDEMASLAAYYPYPYPYSYPYPYLVQVPVTGWDRGPAPQSAPSFGWGAPIPSAQDGYLPPGAGADKPTAPFSVPAAQAGPVGTSSPAQEGPVDPPSQVQSADVVDINTATIADIREIGALDNAPIGRILIARSQRGGFTDLDDLAEAASLQAGQVLALWGRVVFSPFPATPPGTYLGRRGRALGGL